MIFIRLQTLAGCHPHMGTFARYRSFQGCTMSELIPVLENALAEAEARRPATLCAVVATRGSAPQQPGAAMLLRADGSTCGTLGGGCVEQEVKRRAHQALATGAPQLMEFVLNHDYGWDDGLICGGHMEIAAVPLTSPPFLAAARAQQPAAINLCLPRAGQSVEYRLHLEPAPTLLIAGAGHVGTALARLAVDLDFHTIVIDDRADYADPARFPPGVECRVQDIPAALAQFPITPATYVVIVTRGHQHDQQALAAVIQSNANYLGLIGSRRKLRLIFDDLRATGIPAEALARVHAPIGLAIRAITVPEIAVSIAAELIQERRRELFQRVEGPFPAAPSPAAS
jgi:xanthine dehydrogenase accessory factor